LLLGLATCTPPPKAPPPPPRLTLERVAIAALPGWSADRPAEALPAFRRSCAALMLRDAEPDALGAAVADWQPACTAAAQVPDGDDEAARGFFAAEFVPLRAGNNGDSAGLFTGYYEPEIAGARRREERFPAPLLKRPADLVSVELGAFRPVWRGERLAGRVEQGRLVPYASRAEIMHGALDNRRLELLWADPIDLFFLQVQGSGRVRLGDGSIVRVGFDGQNGHPYVALGRILAERGVMTLDEVTMPRLRDWLRTHPDEVPALLAANPSYVFFREVTGEGPLGAQRVALTPGRSLAVDRSFVPLGAPVFLDIEDPLDGSARLQRLVVAQDAGGAIRGPVRGDLFWGAGPEAERRAGMMKSRGNYYLLLPKALAARLTSGL
jgi:membrane-bound lytic murein transglycosylase A